MTGLVSQHGLQFSYEKLLEIKRNYSFDFVCSIT